MGTHCRNNSMHTPPKRLERRTHTEQASAKPNKKFQIFHFGEYGKHPFRPLLKLCPKLLKLLSNGTECTKCDLNQYQQRITQQKCTWCFVTLHRGGAGVAFLVLNNCSKRLNEGKKHYVSTLGYPCKQNTLELGWLSGMGSSPCNKHPLYSKKRYRCRR